MNRGQRPPSRQQSLGEEIANSVSHGVGLLLALIGAPFMIIDAVQKGSIGFVVGASIFSATTILLYLASTLLHSAKQGKAKRVFRIIDYSAIYLMIAGTYTPFTLGVLSGVWGWSIFAVIWLLALFGVALKATGRASHPWVSNGLYLAMGWFILVAIKPLTELVDPAGLAWLVAGGLFYSFGVVFYATDAKLRYGHLIWHLFVMGGTVCHYFAILGYAA